MSRDSRPNPLAYPDDQKINRPYPINGTRKTNDDRTEFQKDKDRILYSKSFRRLVHKTQVSFTGDMNEHIRTRLTHTLEVAQIAKGMARTLKLNEDLVEAIALGHDIGHTPFGHIGEYLLNSMLKGEDKKKILSKSDIDTEKIDIGFKHNYQSARILLYKEEGYSGHKGLNISYPVLEGIIKHSKLKMNGKNIYYENFSDHPELYLEQEFSCSLEGQIVSLADEIAQVSHDIEDAIIGNYDSKKIIILALEEQLKESGLFQNIENEGFILNDGCVKHIDMDYFKEFISWAIHNIIIEVLEKIKEKSKTYIEDKKRYDQKYYPISKNIASEKILNEIKIYQILSSIENKYIINNHKINKENGKGDFILRQIIKAYLTNPKQLPNSVLRQYGEICNIDEIKENMSENQYSKNNIRYLDKDVWDNNLNNIKNDEKFLRLLCDYIASMTDLFAFSEYEKLYLDKNTNH